MSYTASSQASTELRLLPKINCWVIHNELHNTANLRPMTLMLEIDETVTKSPTWSDSLVMIEEVSHRFDLMRIQISRHTSGVSSAYIICSRKT